MIIDYHFQSLCETGSKLKPSSNTIIEAVVAALTMVVIVYYFRDYVGKACWGIRGRNDNDDNEGNIFVHAHAAHAAHVHNVHNMHSLHQGTPVSDDGSNADETTSFSGDGVFSTPVAGEVELVPVVPISVVSAGAGGAAVSSSSSTVLISSSSTNFSRLFGLPIFNSAPPSSSASSSSSSAAVISVHTSDAVTASARQHRSLNVVDVHPAQVMLIGEEGDDEYSLHNDDVRAECV